MNQQARRVFLFGPFRLEPSERRLLREGEPIALTPKAFETLAALVENCGHLSNKEALMARVWPDTFVEEATLAQNISTLRKALGDTPEGTSYIETIPRKGYRFIAPVQECLEEPDGVQKPPSALAPAPFGDAAMPARRSPTRFRAGRFVLAAATILLVSLGAIYIERSRVPKPVPVVAGAPVKSIAVLPLKPVGSAQGADYLGLGLADALITRLGNLPQLVVRPTSSVQRFSSPDQDPLDAGRTLRADAVLDGRFQLSKNRIRVTVQLLDVRDGNPIWMQEFDEQSSDLFSLEDSIADRLADALTLKLAPEEKSLLTRHSTDDARAYEAYLKGRYFWSRRTKEGLQKATQYFQEALSLDPNYARAYAGLADAYILLGPYDVLPHNRVYPEARAAALRAVQLDDTIAEGHTSIAFVRLLYDWNPQAAEQEFRRALALNPNYPTARHWHAYNLVAMGKYDAALAELERAEQLDPVSPSIAADVAQVLYFARRYDDAIRQCRKALDLDPQYGTAHWYLGLLYELKKRQAEAVEEFLKQIPDEQKDPRLIEQLRAAFRDSGMQGFWRAQLERAQKKAQGSYVSPFSFAVLAALSGERDVAFQWLRRAYQDRYPSMVFLQADPVFDSIRADPRFVQLLDQVGIVRKTSPGPRASK